MISINSIPDSNTRNYTFCNSIIPPQFAQQDVMVDWHLQPKYHSLDKQSIQDQKCTADNPCSQDAVATPLLNQSSGYRTYQRYYHVFRSGELSNLFKTHISSAHVEEEYYDRDNWCVIATKM